MHCDKDKELFCLKFGGLSFRNILACLNRVCSLGDSSFMCSISNCSSSKDPGLMFVSLIDDRFLFKNTYLNSEMIKIIKKKKSNEARNDIKRIMFGVSIRGDVGTEECPASARTVELDADSAGHGTALAWPEASLAPSFFFINKVSLLGKDNSERYLSAIVAKGPVLKPFGSSRYSVAATPPVARWSCPEEPLELWKGRCAGWGTEHDRSNKERNKSRKTEQ